jgi:NAD(P)H-dependent FMN reductase
MKNIIAFAGSNSKNSINKQLALYASTLVENVNVTVLDLNDFDLPIYSIDLEIEKGIPDNAHTFLNHIKSSDGIILSLAEHNGTYATVFKNMFDWMSRIDGKVWSQKPMLLLATSPGPRGGSTGLEIAKARFPFNGGNIVADYSLPSFGSNFQDDQITDDDLNRALLVEVEKFQNSL